jgi:hypothetical protein
MEESVNHASLSTIGDKEKIKQYFRTAQCTFNRHVQQKRI